MSTQDQSSQVDSAAERNTAQAASPSPMMPVNYVPFYIAIPVFTGDRSGGVGVGEWISKVEAAFRAWRTPDDQKVEVILHHLAGDARREILVLPSEQRKSAKYIFSTLKGLYGEKDTIASLLGRLHSRCQKSGETTRQYALALQEIGGRMESTKPDFVKNVDDLLCSCFVEGLRQGQVRVAVSRHWRQNQPMGFAVLKREATKIEEEEEAGTGGEREQASVYAIHQNPPPATKTKDPIVQQLIAEMKSLRTTVSQLSEKIAQRNVPERKPMRNPNWDESGRPRCFNCRRFGHLARDCPVADSQRASYMWPPQPPPFQPQQPNTTAQQPNENFPREFHRTPNMWPPHPPNVHVQHQQPNPSGPQPDVNRPQDQGN